MLVVASRLDPAEAMNIDARRDGLRAAGYVDGRNVVIAKALGLTIPPSLLLRADQVIE